MPVFNNLFNFKINKISNVGSVSFGNALHNSHTSNFKVIGTNTSIGDLSPAYGLTNNAYIDPDISDQDQIMNPAIPISKQF